MNHNGFIVSIPKDLSLIKSKLFMGLTKRQLIGFGSGIALGVPIFFLLYSISVDVAMYGAFLVMVPFFIGTIYQKNRLYADKWVKLWFTCRFIFPSQRKIKVTKRNQSVLLERGLVIAKKKKPISDNEAILSASQKGANN